MGSARIPGSGSYPSRTTLRISRFSSRSIPQHRVLIHARPRNCLALAAGATGPANAVNIVLGHVGQFVVDDVRQAHKSDLVITADIPLAAEVIAEDRLALNPRGDLYTEENIRERLNLWEFMDSLRSSELTSGGPPAFSQGDGRGFANQLDRLPVR